MPLPISLVAGEDEAQVNVLVEEIIIEAIQFDASLAVPVLQNGKSAATSGI